MADTLEVTQKEFKELKQLYAEAVKDKKDQLIFKERVLVTGYAKYLIEWLEPQFKPKK